MRRIVLNSVLKTGDVPAHVFYVAILLEQTECTVYLQNGILVFGMPTAMVVHAVRKLGWKCHPGGDACKCSLGCV